MLIARVSLTPCVPVEKSHVAARHEVNVLAWRFVPSEQDWWPDSTFPADPLTFICVSPRPPPNRLPSRSCAHEDAPTGPDQRNRVRPPGPYRRSLAGAHHPGFSL